MGNEVKGVHQEVVDASDGCLEVSIRPSTGSNPYIL